MNKTIIQPNHGNIKPTHRVLVLNHLLQGNTITQAEFCVMTSLGSRLAPRILDLINRGYPIKDINKDKGKDKDGSDKFSKYKLTDEFLSDVAKYGESKALLRQLDRNNAKLQEAINGN